MEYPLERFSLQNFLFQEQVHKFIEAQNKSSEESEHEDWEQETIGETEETKVRNATIRELRRITNRPDLIRLKIFDISLLFSSVF